MDCLNCKHALDNHTSSGCSHSGCPCERSFRHDLNVTPEHEQLTIQAAFIKELEAELAASERTRAKVAEAERDIIAAADRLDRIVQDREAKEVASYMLALVYDHEKDAAAHRLQLAAFDRSDSHGVDPLGTLIERALAERDTLAAEVRAWRDQCVQEQTGGDDGDVARCRLLKAMAATDAAAALGRAGGAT